MSATVHALCGVVCKVCSPVTRCLTSNQNYYYVYQIRRYGALAFKCFMRVLGPVMITLALSLLTFILTAFLFYIVPDITHGDLYQFAALFVLGIFILVNVVFNYMACAFTPPGEPQPCADPAAVMGERVVTVDGRKVRQIRHAIVLAPGVSYRYCRHCKCIKPPRAHHDSISGKCVLLMDHYCPWMNNCVGQNNYRHFCLFLLYLGVGAVYCLCITTHYFASPFPYQRQRDTPGYEDINTAIMFSYTIALSAGISVSLLGWWHVYLCLSNQTTIEFYINMEERSEARAKGLTYRNPFDKGWRKNLLRVFGDVAWWEALAMSLRPAVCYSEYPPLPDKSLVHLANQVVNV